MAVANTLAQYDMVTAVKSFEAQEQLPKACKAPF